MKFNERVEQILESFEGLTGGAKNQPLKLKKKLEVTEKKSFPGSDNMDYYISLDEDGYWYLHNDGKPHFGMDGDKSSGYFKSKKDAEKALKNFKKKL